MNPILCCAVLLASSLVSGVLGKGGNCLGGLDPELCGHTIFTGVTEYEGYFCRWGVIEPTILGRSSFVPEMPTTAPPEIVDISKGIVQCPIASDVTVHVVLWVLQNGTWKIHSAIEAYPKGCFDCSAGQSSCRLKNVENDTDVRCFIQNKCYPAFALNVNNKSETCNPAQNTSSWSETPEPASYNNTVPLDVCEMQDHRDRYRNATAIGRQEAPERVQAMTFHDGSAYIHNPDFLNASLISYAFSLHFFVKFDFPPVAEPVTFMELQPAIKLQRRPDDLIQVEFSFYNLLSVQKVVKTVLLQDDNFLQGKEDLSEGRIQSLPLGMQLKVTGNITSVEWISVGLGYDARDPSLSFFLNGNKLEKNLGDLSDLQLLFSGNLVLSAASVSCIETDTVMQEPEFFKRPSLCKTNFEEIKHILQDCERNVNLTNLMVLRNATLS